MQQPTINVVDNDNVQVVSSTTANVNITALVNEINMMTARLTALQTELASYVSAAQSAPTPVTFTAVANLTNASFLTPSLNTIKPAL